MTNEEALKLTERAARIIFSKDAKTVNVDLTLPLIFGIVGCLQLSFRHPENIGPTRDQVEKWLLDLIERADPSKGDVYKMLMLGFNTRFDDLLDDIPPGEMFTIAVSCPECGSKSEEKTDNPAILHKTKTCSGCAGENGDSERSDLNWSIPKRLLDETIEDYEALLGTPGVNTALALAHVLRPLAARYANGERSEELYNLMMNVS